MGQIRPAPPAATFKTFYYFTLIAWTVASLGLASELRKDLRAGEYVMIFSSLALTLFGWSLPILQLKHPERPFLIRSLVFFPIFCSTALIIALTLGVLFGAP